MHGLIFRGFRAFADEAAGGVAASVWEGEPEYLATESYPDERFFDLVGRTCEVLGAERRQLLLDFGSFTGRYVFSSLYPDYYAEAGGTSAFLLCVEGRIHQLVRDTIPKAYPPRLQVRPLGSSGAMVSYTSERGLCDLLEGLVLGVAAYYGESVDVQQVQCMHRGDLGCAFAVQPVSSGSAAPA